MKYTHNYICTRDIDFFFYLNGIPVHAASVGGPLPCEVNNVLHNRVWQKATAFPFERINESYNRSNPEMLECFDLIKEVEISEDIRHELMMADARPDERKDFYRTFVAMAALGFYSYIRDCNSENDYCYRLVARPRGSSFFTLHEEFIAETKKNMSFDERMSMSQLPCYASSSFDVSSIDQKMEAQRILRTMSGYDLTVPNRDSDVLDLRNLVYIGKRIEEIRFFSSLL